MKLINGVKIYAVHETPRFYEELQKLQPEERARVDFIIRTSTMTDDVLLQMIEIIRNSKVRRIDRTGVDKATFHIEHKNALIAFPATLQDNLDLWWIAKKKDIDKDLMIAYQHIVNKYVLTNLIPSEIKK